MALIFISHSSKDNEKTQEISNTLKEKGLKSNFLDFDEKKGIKPGDDWERRLYDEIKKANAILLI